MCLEAMVLVGYLMTAQPNPSHITNLDGPLLEVQTCERGVGAFAKASPSGVGAVGVQYGAQWHPADQWTLTITPQFGVGLLDRHVHEVSSQVNFSLGLNAMLGFRRSRVAVEYWHHSNAGLGRQNAGLDMLALMGGWAF